MGSTELSSIPRDSRDDEFRLPNSPESWAVDPVFNGGGAGLLSPKRFPEELGPEGGRRPWYELLQGVY
jgi:hypothetical protein